MNKLYREESGFIVKVPLMSTILQGADGIKFWESKENLKYHHDNKD